MVIVGILFFVAWRFNYDYTNKATKVIENYKSKIVNKTQSDISIGVEIYNCKLNISRETTRYDKDILVTVTTNTGKQYKTIIPKDDNLNRASTIRFTDINELTSDFIKEILVTEN